MECASLGQTKNISRDITRRSFKAQDRHHIDLASVQLLLEAVLVALCSGMLPPHVHCYHQGLDTGKRCVCTPGKKKHFV